MIHKKNASLSKKRKELYTQRVLFAVWGVDNKNDSLYQNWYLPLKKMVGEVILFDAGQEYFRKGKERMNAEFLATLKKMQPDYLFLNLMYDEFELSTLQQIQDIAPQTKVVNLFSDDDWRFESFTRFYGLFVDYSITTHDLRKEYKKDGIDRATFFIAANCDHFKPLKEKKIYDVVFFGKPNPSRVELMELLIKKGVTFHLWGEGWERYPQFKKYYHGYLAADQLLKVINQSKIVLGFTMGGYGKPQIKGRPFEVAACRSFSLVEYYEKYLNFFKEGKDIVMFKGTEELVKKIQYYLKNEKEREKIANAAYLKVINYHNQPREIEKFLLQTLDHRPIQKTLPKIKGKYMVISSKDVLKSRETLQKELGDIDYVTFSTHSKSHPLRYYFQAYALEKSGKDICCCDYYVSKPFIKNYLLFKSEVASQKLSPEEFTSCIDLSQIMLRKEYLLSNLEQWQVQQGIPLIEKENIAFIAIPLITLSKLKTQNQKILENAFQMKFLDRLYSLYKGKRMVLSAYPYALFLTACLQDKFIFNTLRNALKDPKKLAKLKEKS